MPFSQRPPPLPAPATTGLLASPMDVPIDGITGQCPLHLRLSLSTGFQGSPMFSTLSLFKAE